VGAAWRQEEQVERQAQEEELRAEDGDQRGAEEADYDEELSEEEREQEPAVGVEELQNNLREDAEELKEERDIEARLRAINLKMTRLKLEKLEGDAKILQLEVEEREHEIARRRAAMARGETPVSSSPQPVSSPTPPAMQHDLVLFGTLKLARAVTKLTLESLKGRPEKVENWIYEMEGILRNQVRMGGVELSEAAKLELAKEAIDLGISNWWDIQLRVPGTEKTWPEFKSALMTQFGPVKEDRRNKAVEGLHSLRHEKSESVREYFARMEDLQRHAEFSDETFNMAFLGKAIQQFDAARFPNINQEMRQFHSRTPFTSLAQMKKEYIRAATYADLKPQPQQQQQQQPPARHQSGAQRPLRAAVATTSESTEGEETREKEDRWKIVQEQVKDLQIQLAAATRQSYPDTCARCKKKGHRATNCTAPDTRQCYNCNEKGHISPNCPKPREKKSRAEGAQSPAAKDTKVNAIMVVDPRPEVEVVVAAAAEVQQDKPLREEEKEKPRVPPKKAVKRRMRAFLNLAAARRKAKNGNQLFILKGAVRVPAGGKYKGKTEGEWVVKQLCGMADTGAMANFISYSAVEWLLEVAGVEVVEGNFGEVKEAFGKTSRINLMITGIPVMYEGVDPKTGRALKTTTLQDAYVVPGEKELGAEFQMILGYPFLKQAKANVDYDGAGRIDFTGVKGVRIRIHQEAEHFLPPGERAPSDSQVMATALDTKNATETAVKQLEELLARRKANLDQVMLDEVELIKQQRQRLRAARTPAQVIRAEERKYEKLAQEFPDLLMSRDEWSEWSKKEDAQQTCCEVVLNSVKKPIPVAAVSQIEETSAPKEDFSLLPPEERAKAEKIMKKMIEKLKKVFPTDLPDINNIASKDLVNGGVEIKTFPGAQPVGRYGPRMTADDTVEAKKILDWLLEKGFIRESKSPWGAAMFLVNKPDGSKRMVIDYRGLNAVTVRNRYPLPKVDELFDQLKGARYFSKIDLRTGYWQIRMTEDSIEKTAFTSRHGHFEWLVLPMGLTNAPAEFMRMMEDTFRAQLNKSVMVFLDDILIYSDTLEEHEKHVQEVLEKLQEKKLYAKLSKCAFFRQEVEFLGHYVGRRGIRMVDEKVSAVEEWPTPEKQKDVERFIGLAGYYRRFIKDFSKISAPLSELCGTLKKGKKGGSSRAAPKKPFVWGTEQQSAFEEVKRAIMSAPCLTIPDESKPFVVHTDSSGSATGAVLMQEYPEGLRPIAFLSKKMRAAETRYAVHEQELLAIMNALKAWRHYLGGREFTVLTDHQSLQYIGSSAMATPRQLRWAALMSEFDFKIKYTPGDTNVVADALSRRDGVKEEETCALLSAITDAGPLPVRIREAAAEDPSYTRMLGWSQGELASQKMREEDGLLYRLKGDQLVVPTSAELRAWILMWAHDTTEGVHMGAGRMASWLRERVWWKGMTADVQKYTRSCEDCQRSKPDLRGKQGLPRSIETPEAPGDWLSMDFVGPFFESRAGKDAIMVVVDRLTRYVFFIPCSTKSTAEDIWKLMDSQVLVHTGIPRAIVSDRDTRFTSHFWEGLWESMGTALKRSTAFHPQTDGQAEKAVRTLIEAMRTMIDADHENWEELLPSIARAFNGAKCDSTGKSPDQLFHGWERRSLLDAELEAGGVQPRARHPGADEITNRLRVAIEEARAVIEAAQKRQREDSARGRREGEIKVGDMVWLSNRNLRPIGQDRARKLDPLYYGPYKVIRMAGENAAEIELPVGCKLHHTFNLDLLRKNLTEEDRFPNRPRSNDRRGPIPDEDPRAGGPASLDPVYEVERIIGSRVDRAGVTEYRIKWAGWPIEQSSWEKESNCQGSERLIADYVARSLRRSPRRRVAALVGTMKSSSDVKVVAAARRTGAQPAVGSREAERRKDHRESTMENREGVPGLEVKGGEIKMGTQRCVADTRAGTWCQLNTRYGCFCWIHRAQINGTKIKDSTIQGAGKGLFAVKAFKKGETVVRYTGDWVNTADGEMENGFGDSDYVFQYSREKSIDAARTNTADGRMVNSSRGRNQPSNVKFSVDYVRKRVTIRASRAIRVGEELFINYGSAYWERGQPKRVQPAMEGDSGEEPIVLSTLSSGAQSYFCGMIGRSNVDSEPYWFEDERGKWWRCNCVQTVDQDNKHREDMPSCPDCDCDRPPPEPTAASAAVERTTTGRNTRAVGHNEEARKRVDELREADEAQQWARANEQRWAREGMEKEAEDQRRCAQAAAAQVTQETQVEATSLQQLEGWELERMGQTVDRRRSEDDVLALIALSPDTGGGQARQVAASGKPDRWARFREDDEAVGGVGAVQGAQVMSFYQQGQQLGVGGVPPMGSLWCLQEWDTHELNGNLGELPPPMEGRLAMQFYCNLRRDRDFSAEDEARRTVLMGRENRVELARRELEVLLAAREQRIRRDPLPMPPAVLWRDNRCNGGVHRGPFSQEYPKTHVYGALPPVHNDCCGWTGKGVGCPENVYKVFRMVKRDPRRCRRNTCECCAPLMVPMQGGAPGQEVALGHWCSCLAERDGFCRRCWIDYYMEKGKEEEKREIYPWVKNQEKFWRL